MSFVLKMNGAKAEVSRDFALPKTGDFAGVTLKSDYQVVVDLGGIKAGTPLHKQVLTEFENVYRYELKQQVPKLERSLAETWKKGTDAAAKVKDQAQAEKLGKALVKAILDEWNAFPAGAGQRYADSSIASVLKAIKNDAAAKGAKPKMKVSDAALKDDRVGILTSILGGVALVAAGVPTGGLGWLAAGIGGLAAILKGSEKAMAVSAKRSGDIETNMDQMRKGLKAADDALAGLAPSLARMAASRTEFTAEMAEAARSLAEAQKALVQLEARAGKEAGAAEKKRLEGLREEVNLLFFKARAFEKSVSEIDKIERAVEAAGKATAAANALLARETKDWKDQKGQLQSLWKDKDTVLTSVKSVASAFSKL